MALPSIAKPVIILVLSVNLVPYNKIAQNATTPYIVMKIPPPIPAPVNQDTLMLEPNFVPYAPTISLDAILA